MITNYLSKKILICTVQEFSREYPAIDLNKFRFKTFVMKQIRVSLTTRSILMVVLTIKTKSIPLIELPITWVIDLKNNWFLSCLPAQPILFMKYFAVYQR